MQNVEDLVGGLKSLTAAAKLYQKAMEGMLIYKTYTYLLTQSLCLFLSTGMVAASGHFFSILESIGAKASKLPGAVHKLGMW